MERKLYRSRRERMISGVCGGIAEYFDIDPTLVRLITVVLALVSFGTAIIVYLVMSIVVPEEGAGADNQKGSTVAGAPVPPTQQYPPTQTQPPTLPPPAPVPPRPAPPTASSGRRRGGITFGLVLVFLGLALLASQFVPGIDLWRLWPLIIVAIGIRTMFRGGDD